MRAVRALKQRIARPRFRLDRVERPGLADEPAGPYVVRHEVTVPGLDPAHDGLRIAHLTDIHVGLLTPARVIRRAVLRAAAEHADLTVLTGDYLCYGRRFVGRFRELIGGLPGPVVATLGNHDYWTDAPGLVAALQSHHYAVLRNQNTRLMLRGAPLDIVGIDDAVTGHADPERAFAGVGGAASRVVLTHVPGMAKAAAARGPALVLAGHTHGGQINVKPVRRRLIRHFGNDFLAGFYDVGDARLYVNRGVGSSSIPLRVDAPSEVAVLTLRAG